MVMSKPDHSFIDPSEPGEDLPATEAIRQSAHRFFDDAIALTAADPNVEDLDGIEDEGQPRYIWTVTTSDGASGICVTIYDQVTATQIRMIRPTGPTALRLDKDFGQPSIKMDVESERHLPVELPGRLFVTKVPSLVLQEGTNTLYFQDETDATPQGKSFYPVGSMFAEFLRDIIERSELVPFAKPEAE